MNGGWGMILNEVVMVFSKVLSKYLPEEAEKNHENLRTASTS